MIFPERIRYIKKKSKYNHKEWNILNKRKMIKENRERIKHDLDIRNKSVAKRKEGVK